MPYNYKISLIKTLIHRAYKIASTWELFDMEVKRILKNLINNNYPQEIVERVISNTINKLYVKKEHENELQNVTFFYRTYRPYDWVNDQRFLTNIINDHLQPTPGVNLKLRMYYKPKRISNLFSNRLSLPDYDKHGLVYNFSCPEDGCNASYIGYTANRLLVRMGQHKNKQSKIHSHLMEAHNKTPTDDIFPHFKILYMDHSDYNVRTAEALFIKSSKPSINKQFKDMALTLHLFN
jgi:hypothetical protein